MKLGLNFFTPVKIQSNVKTPVLSSLKADTLSFKGEPINYDNAVEQIKNSKISVAYLFNQDGSLFAKAEPGKHDPNLLVFPQSVKSNGKNLYLNKRDNTENLRLVVKQVQSGGEYTEPLSKIRLFRASKMGLSEIKVIDDKYVYTLKPAPVQEDPMVLKKKSSVFSETFYHSRLLPELEKQEEAALGYKLPSVDVIYGTPGKGKVQRIEDGKSVRIISDEGTKKEEIITKLYLEKLHKAWVETFKNLGYIYERKSLT